MKMEEEEEEEEERFVHLERRLVPNVNFDGTLQVLGFYSYNYQILSNLGWVKFFNGVGVSTHKELSLAPVTDEEVSCLSFRLEDEELLVPYGYFRELLGPNKEAPEQVEDQQNMLEGFLGMISGEDYKEPKISPCWDLFGGRVPEARKIY
jgi:hypothetical protein